MAALRQMRPQVTLLVAALAAVCSGAPAPAPSPSPSPSHLLPAVWGGPVVAGFPVAVPLPLYAGLEGALAAHARHAFLAAPGALLTAAAAPAASYGYGYGYPLSAYGSHAAYNIPTASEIYTPHVQAVHTLQAVPVANTVQALPVEYGAPRPAVVAAVTEETPKETPAPESDKSGDTSQVGAQAVGIDLSATSGSGSEGETSGFSAGGGGGGAEFSAAATEAPATEAVAVEAATEAPVTQATTPRGAYKLSIAYGVPRAPTVSENISINKENFKSNQFDNVESGSQSGPKIQSLDDLISETYSSTAEADSQGSLSGSRTGSLDFVDVSSDARTLGASGGLDCTGKGCGTKDIHVFDRIAVPTNSGAFRLSLRNEKHAAASNEVADVSFGQETVSSQGSAAVPNRAAKQHYYYDLPHLAGVGAATAAAASGQGGSSGGSSSTSASSSSASGGFTSGQDTLSGSGPNSASSSSFASGSFTSGQDTLSGSGPNSASSSSFASGGFTSGQGSLSGSGPNSDSSSSFDSSGFISPSTSESHPNYPNSVPVPPKPYSAPVPPYPNTTPPPPYPKYGAPVYSAPAFSPPGGFAPSQPVFATGSHGGDAGSGVFTPISGAQAQAQPPVVGDEDGVYPPAQPPSPAYGIPQPPPPPSPVDSYGHPVRDLYDIRSGRSIPSGQSTKQRSSSNRRRFV